MSNNKITIEQAKQQLTEGFSSILTREDVLHLLDCLEVTESETQFGLTPNQLTELSADIANEIADEGTNIVEDYELSMSYKEVELDSIDFDQNRIHNITEKAIKHFINTMNS